MLRRRSSGVARHSLHMTGQALDVHFPDVSMAKVRDMGLRLQAGGVGYYPRANNAMGAPGYGRRPALAEGHARPSGPAPSG